MTETTEMREGTLYTVHYGNLGPMLELAEKERKAYVDPATVRLTYRGKELTPTQFDERGNPLIGGMMREVMLWENAQLARDGKIKKTEWVDFKVEYAYTVSETKIEVPLSLRLPQAGVCPICGQPITLKQLDEMAPRVAHPEYYYTGQSPFYGVISVHKEGTQPVLAHRECYERYHTLRWTNKVMSAVEEGFLYRAMEEVNKLHWGEGERGVQVEEIPSQDLSKLDYVRRPWFRFQTPFGSFEIRGWQYTVETVLLPDFMEFDLSDPPKGAIVKTVGGNRTITCGGNYHSFCWVLSFIRKVVCPDPWLDKPLKERITEDLGMDLKEVEAVLEVRQQASSRSPSGLGGFLRRLWPWGRR